MSSERDACLRKADEAKQRAAQATEPSIKSAYEKVAEHWMLLARLESLVGAEKNSEDTLAKKLTALPLAADTQRTKESLGHIRGFQGVDLSREQGALDAAILTQRCISIVAPNYRR